MILHRQTLLSEDLLEKEFVCDLHACKGACCVEGDEGAPLEVSETRKLSEIYDQIAPYLSMEGKRVLHEKGLYQIDPEDGEPVTPTLGGRECAYAVYDENGVLGCGIEKAWQAGATDFRKPISCHLYPVRIRKTEGYEGLNYHKWSICSAACTLGQRLQVPVFRFVKEALIRHYGREWYDELEELAESYLHGQG